MSRLNETKNYEGSVYPDVTRNNVSTTTYAGRDVFHLTLEKLKSLKSKMAADSKRGSAILVTATQALSAYKTVMENYFVYLQNILKQEVLLSSKQLIALFNCREVKLPRSIWVKARSSDRFWKNLMNGMFSDEDFRLGRIEFQNLANEC